MAGLFVPGSVSWRVNRELLVLAGGTCALLMQIAHPAVAAGVEAHSNFQADPFGRLQRTLGASWAIVFGDGPSAERALRRIDATHAVVRGFVPETGTPYRARDPQLLLWVHATLVDTAVRMHHRFVAPLTAADVEAYYRETMPVAVALGVPESTMPATYQDMRAWMVERIAAGEVRVTPTARRLSEAILYPTAFPPRFVWTAAHLASVSLLHPDVRRGYGLVWNADRAAGVARLARFTRWAVPRLPGRLRFAPAARRAEAARGSGG